MRVVKETSILGVFRRRVEEVTGPVVIAKASIPREGTRIEEVAYVLPDSGVCRIELRYYALKPGVEGPYYCERVRDLGVGQSTGRGFLRRTIVKVSS